MSSRTPQPDDDGFTGYEPEPLPYPDIDTGGKDPWEERLRAIGKLPEKPTPKPVDIPDLDAPKEHLDSYAQSALRNELGRLAAATEGTRNTTLFIAAAALRRFVRAKILSEAFVEDQLLQQALAIGLTEREARKTIASARRKDDAGGRKVELKDRDGYGKLYELDDPTDDGQQASPTGSSKHPADQHQGQAKFAYLLAERYADQLLHVHGLGWHAWRGTRWAPDDRGVARRAVLDVLRHAWEEAFGSKELTAEVKQCQTATAVNGILALAASLEPFAATVDDLNAVPWLLNCANGTLDLHTLELHPHEPSERLTKVCRGAYRPDTAAPTWDAFLARVLPDEEVRGFVQRLAGMALIGDVREHVLPIFTGTGRNGKSVFYKALSSAMGDYAATADPELFMARRDGAHPTGEMDLMGRRLVVVSESNRDRRLDEAKMKRLVGGDPIKARRMRQDFVEFMPSHTAVLVTNHLPKVSGDDPATWARLRVVPFNVVIPPAEQDTELSAKLELEADGILSWAVAGLRDYLERGLDDPRGVRVATAAYHRDSDALARFIDECCETGSAYQERTSELHAAWVGWQLRDGAEPMSMKAFGQALDARGFTSKKVKSGICRVGIRLLPSGTDFDANSPEQHESSEGAPCAPSAVLPITRAGEELLPQTVHKVHPPICASPGCGQQLTHPESVEAGLCAEHRLGSTESGWSA